MKIKGIKELVETGNCKIFTMKPNKRIRNKKQIVNRLKESGKIVK